MNHIVSARELGATVRGRRAERGRSQEDVAEAANVSRQWLSEVEAGKPTAEIGLVLRLLDVLDLDVVAQPRERRRPRTTSNMRNAVDLDDVLEEYGQR